MKALLKNGHTLTLERGKAKKPTLYWVVDTDETGNKTRRQYHFTNAHVAKTSFYTFVKSNDDVVEVTE